MGTPATDKKKELGGILNIGNSCYMGAAIQVLANVSALSNFLLQSEQRLSDIQLVKEYVQMVKSILVLGIPAEPYDLKAVIAGMNAFFADSNQHDSQEFIQFFVDALHEAMKGFLRAVTQGVSGDMYNNTEEDYNGAAADGQNDHDAIWRSAVTHWKKEVINRKKGSIILDLFAGQFLSKLSCPNCLYSSKTFELFTMLQLQIPIPECISIPFRVINRDEDISCAYHVLRLPIAIKLSVVKKIIAKRAAINSKKLVFIILNKNNGDFNAELSQKFIDAGVPSSEGDSDDDDAEEEDNFEEEDDDDDEGSESSSEDPDNPTLRDIPMADIDIWCFKRLFKDKDEEGQGDQLICISLAERFANEPQYFTSLSHADELPNDVPLISIKNCFADFVKPEQIEGSHCEHCSKQSPPKSTTLVKQLSFTRLPDILVICFKRFTYDSFKKKFVKQSVPVSFPLDNFNLSKYLSSDVPAELVAQLPRYNCIGIVTHHGDLNYGHYCSFVRDGFSDDWVFCNDDRTYEAQSSEVDTKNAYIVFYQRATSALPD